MKRMIKRNDLMEQNLELARKFLLDVMKNPQRAAHIPPGATLVLYPVRVKEERMKAAA